ncbi:hypothetical protein CC1G_09640 [Coprinopsis cinerea okayama7|uniref:Uncharacterized protein n=1 Tax=Coprinopsis cinerea (strain Okayama-7 / 130 / ATCC MYA-4618 / FGSC 9003) TaxID=240176 RepID=A8P9B8_COPC7|nr:hypothetical protein CC1G_09640 [Coprinopsis cinerea okayama7\|eukprot:XP_001839737.2 hypothetical protein CC1G_09640 [Coprinopsis cinerea okayama7\
MGEEGRGGACADDCRDTTNWLYVATMSERAEVKDPEHSKAAVNSEDPIRAGETPVGHTLNEGPTPPARELFLGFWKLVGTSH